MQWLAVIKPDISLHLTRQSTHFVLYFDYFTLHLSLQAYIRLRCCYATSNLKYIINCVCRNSYSIKFMIRTQHVQEIQLQYKLKATITCTLYQLSTLHFASAATNQLSYKPYLLKSTLLRQTRKFRSFDDDNHLISQYTRLLRSESSPKVSMVEAQNKLNVKNERSSMLIKAIYYRNG